MQNENPISKVDAKDHDSIRFVSFNINGIKTLTNYYPWNQYSNNFDAIFKSLHADIISLQELKLTSGNLSAVNIANLNDYRSFISLPKQKKGYSGVGLFIRKPADDEPDTIRHHLNVVKAEEGITGMNKTSQNVRYIDMAESEAIGGYVQPSEQTADATGDIPATYSAQDLSKLDNEGRAVVVELSCGLVVFSLYCPANSMGTEEGEKFKDSFMDILIRRCQNLHRSGKQILILGDINVSLHLIDQAEGINERMKKKLVTYTSDGEAFERVNASQCLDFKLERYSRFHLNQYVCQDLTDLLRQHFNESLQFLYDTTRLIQKRKLGLYTCWNTLTGARQTNYGSRIDLILATKSWGERVVSANTWPFLMGSDHCPIFTDFKVEGVIDPSIQKVKLQFEASSFYNLGRHRDISTMFQMSRKRKPESQGKPDSEQKKPDSVGEGGGKKHKEVSPITSESYKSRKGKAASQTQISNFFYRKSTELEQLKIEKEIRSQAHDKTEQRSAESLKGDDVDKSEVPTRRAVDLKSVYGEAPTCEHGIPCQLKTSLNNPKTRGRKFWCCSIMGKGFSKGLDEGRCDYFQWLKTRD